MSGSDENGWHEAGADLEHIPNNCFDVIAKYYDAGFDRMMIVRIAGCVRVGDRIIWTSPFPTLADRDDLHVDILKYGFRPTHWRLVPEPPTFDGDVEALRQAQEQG